MRLIDADELSTTFDDEGMDIVDNGYPPIYGFSHRLVYDLIESAPTVQPKAEKLLKILCEGFLDMPSGCDGCPLSETQTLEKDRNAICELERYLRGN